MVKRKELVFGAALLLITLMQAYDAFGFNLGFETGNTSGWSTSYSSSFGRDYTSIVSSNWSSEGIYSLFIGGASNGMIGFPQDKISVGHDTLVVESGDQVCLDFHKEGTNNNGFIPSVNGKRFQNFLASGDTLDLCAFAAGNGPLNVTVEGSNTFGCPGGCIARIFMDNVRVLTCRDGIMNQDETDIDCGGVCDSCLLGEQCIKNSDCASFFCNTNQTCANPLSFSHQFNYNFEIGTSDFWGFNFTSGGQDYTSIINQNWVNEGDFSLQVAGGNIGTLSSQSATFFHNSTSLEKGDVVCMNLLKNESNRGTWRVDLVSGGNFINFIPTGEYINLCATSLGDDTLGVTVKGTENFACTAGNQCFAKFFVDNITINQANCTDGNLNRFETDVDCGGFCSPCSAGKNCNLDFDCESGFCDNGACSGVEEDLLAKYAPVLYFHPDEQFFPTTIEAMLNESDLWEDDLFRDDLIQERPVFVENLSGPDVTDEYFLDMVNASGGIGSFEVPTPSRFSKYPKAVYARNITRESNVVLQYWFFYPFNNWTNKHEGDWEMIQIILDQDKEPMTATYSFHWGGKTHQWSEIEKINDTHPAVYVTNGGHGVWKEEGIHEWNSDILDFIPFSPTVCRNFFDVTSNLGDIFEPNDYELLKLSSWSNFKGLWGEVGSSTVGTSGPNSPANIMYEDAPNRWSDPVLWSNSPNPSAYVVCSGSPVNILVFDEQGNKIGLNASNEIVSEIEETFYYFPSDDGSELIAILDSKPITFVVEGTGDGAFNLSIGKFDRISSTQVGVEYRDIPVTNDTIAVMNFTPNNPNFIMQIDNNGDGVVDQTRQPDSVEGNQTSTETDTDNDGIADSVDNCPNLNNPNQIIDFDGDGFDHPLCGGTDCNDNSSSIFPDAPELCDAVDNDCDLSIDENLMRTLGTDIGECEFEKQTCVFGVWNTIIEGVEPILDSCNEKDDDCDGKVDNRCSINSKELAIQMLQAINNSEADKVIQEIEKSLNPIFFLDNETLDPKKGGKVFDFERKAVIRCLYNWKLKQFDPLCKDVSQLLKDADQKFAEKALESAKSLNVTNPKNQRCYDKVIPKAEKNLLRGDSRIGTKFVGLAITFYKRSWRHSQKTIEIAEAEKRIC